MNITLLVTKINVYDEVSKTSSYTGAKMDDNGSGYMRIFTIDEDRVVLERFWNEACNKVVDLVKPFIVSISKLVESHTIAKNMAQTTMKESATSSKWFRKKTLWLTAL